MSLGVVVIDTCKLFGLQQLPESGAVDPRKLLATEEGKVLGTMLPGRNAAKKDNTDPRTWFRQIINKEFENAKLGDETFADTLYGLLGKSRTIRCPSNSCGMDSIRLPKPLETEACPSCGVEVLLSDGLRIHEQFEENSPAIECHARFRDVLEILALINSLRYLIKTPGGRNAIRNTAFVLDGPLAAFGTIAVLTKAVRDEFRRIQTILDDDGGGGLLVMSGVKSGPFVEHAAEIDRAPEPNKRIPANHYWLPTDAYIRKNIVAGRAEQSKPWGELTYFGRPVVIKTGKGQRLVLNLAQPEASPPLTNAGPPNVLGDAIATAGPLGVGAHQFLPLRRVHAQAAIPLRIGTDLISSLSP